MIADTAAILDLVSRGLVNEFLVCEYWQCACVEYSNGECAYTRIYAGYRPTYAVRLWI